MGFFGPPAVAAATSIIPSDVAGLKLWLDATKGLFDATSGGSAVTADGSAVARWEDQSGNGNHLTQATSNNRPVLKTSIQNGKNVIRFDGSNDRLTGGDVLDLGTDGITIFAVVKITGSNGAVISKSRATGQDGRWFILREANVLYCNFAATINRQPQISSDTTTSFRIITFSAIRKEAVARINKSVSATFSVDTTNHNTTNVLLVGTYPDSSGNEASIYPLNGDIAEILVYIGDRVSDQNISGLEDYLATKWGI